MVPREEVAKGTNERTTAFANSMDNLENFENYSGEQVKGYRVRDPQL
jgi:hypothetical protein